MLTWLSCRLNNRIRIFCLILLVMLFIYCYLFVSVQKKFDFGFIMIDLQTNETTIKSNIICSVKKCTNEERKMHGELFASFSSAWSSCYNDFYLSAFENHSTPVEILLDVGANKAYSVATWLAFFLPELGIDQARLGEYIQRTRSLNEYCGSCNDCQDKPLNRTNPEHKYQLQIHAFEPQPGTVTILNEIKYWMNISERSTSKLEIHGMAVSNQTGKILFKKCNAGNEVCSLDISQASADEQIYVNTTTLDDFVKQNQLSRIDILKIDTEGYEPLVFQGAKQLLNQHRIRLFIFEHLKGAVWKSTSLEKETSILLERGYVCYMIGKTGLIRISNCWNDQFNVEHNNVLCVSSKDSQLYTNIDQMRLSNTTVATCRNKSK